MLTSLEVAVAIARGPSRSRPKVTLADAEAALGTKALRYGRDEHYDVISAFIKSIRGSDPDAGLYWLARMLEAGEDARFIVRRLIILASEDIGEADPQALSVAVAAAHAARARRPARGAAQPGPGRRPPRHRAEVEPERPRHLARARGRAPRPVGGGARPPPRRAATRAAAKLGHGAGYDYPHDDPEGWVPQPYLPDELGDRTYYDPSPHGFEQEIRTRMERRNRG